MDLQPGGMSCRDAGRLKGKSHMRSALFVLLLMTTATVARDDGRYANSPLKPWFDSLKSGKGFCCSEADGRETEYAIHESRYWLPVNGFWTEVPDDARITEPNRAGRPMLWLDPLQNIRCFIPGPGLGSRRPRRISRPAKLVPATPNGEHRAEDTRGAGRSPATSPGGGNGST